MTIHKPRYLPDSNNIDQLRGNLNDIFSILNRLDSERSTLRQATSSSGFSFSPTTPLPIVSTAYIPLAAATETSHYTGFINRTDTSLAFVAGALGITRTLTLTCAGKSIWIAGTKYTLAADLTKQIPDTTGLYWFWITAPGGVPQLNASTDHPENGYGGARAGFDQCLVAQLYWNTTTDAAILCDERHWAGRDCWYHEYLHETVGARWFNGGTITPTNITFAITQCEMYDEDIEHTLTAATVCKILYHNGSSAWEWDENSTLPYKLNGNKMQYNNGTALANCATSDHLCMWLYATNHTTYPFMFVMGNSVTTLANARLTNPPSFGQLPSVEYKLLFRLIFKQNVSSVTYVEAADYRTNATIGSTYTPTDHSVLSNLDYTTSGHTGFAASAHDHSQLVIPSTTTAALTVAATTGYVGVGVAAASQALDVLGNIVNYGPSGVYSLTGIDENNFVEMYYTTGVGNIQTFASNAVGPLALNPLGGSVCIGATTGSSTLNVVGSMHVGSTGTLSDAGAGNLIVDGTTTISTIAALGSAATVFLTHTAGLLQTRTAANVLSDIGAAPASHYLLNSNHADTEPSAVNSGKLIVGWSAVEGTSPPKWNTLDRGVSDGMVLQTISDGPINRYGIGWQTLADAGIAAASHDHAWGDITSGKPTTLSGYGITDGVTTSDGRLSDARTPTAHAASHFHNGSDSVEGVFNNFGERHATFTDFDSVDHFGPAFVQGTTNGPGIPSATQYYQQSLGLGSEYAYSQYAMQTAIPRTPEGGLPYLSVRFRESTTWSAWSKIYAGYADVAGDVYSWAKEATKPSYSYSEVGADVAGASATVQGNLNTHAGLTTTAHGLGASAFHADNYFAAATHYHSSLMASDGDPNPVLSIDSTGNTTIQNAATVAALQLKIGTAAADSGTYVAELDFITSGTAQADKRAAIVASQLTAASGTVLYGDLEFFTANGGAPAERMRITSEGHLGINTTTPVAALDVNGDGRFGGILTRGSAVPGIFLSNESESTAGKISHFSAGEGSESIGQIEFMLSDSTYSNYSTPMIITQNDVRIGRTTVLDNSFSLNVDGLMGAQALWMYNPSDAIKGYIGYKAENGSTTLSMVGEGDVAIGVNCTTPVMAIKINAAGDVYTTADTDYSGSSTITGFGSSTFLAKVIQYKVLGKTVKVDFSLATIYGSGSDVSFTLPLSAKRDTYFLCYQYGSGASFGEALITSGTGTVTIGGSTWSGGTRVTRGQFEYEIS
jgi:hypothetical protein